MSRINSAQELGWFVAVEQPEADATRDLRSSLIVNLWLGAGTALTVSVAVTFYRRRLDAMAITDKLTGLANRQAFDDTTAHLLKSPSQRAAVRRAAVRHRPLQAVQRYARSPARRRRNPQGRGDRNVHAAPHRHGPVGAAKS